MNSTTWDDLSTRLEEGRLGKAWLVRQCSLIDPVRRAVLVLGPADLGPFVPEAFWPEDEVATPLMADVADQTLQARTPVTVSGEGCVVVGFPLILPGGHLHGLVALELDDLSDRDAARVLDQLRWGSQVLMAALMREQGSEEQVTRERLMSTLDLLASVLTEGPFDAAANVLATDLATALDCDRVSIGFRRDLRSRVEALSHSAQMGRRMNLMRDVEAAMDEAIDQKSMVRLPEVGEEVLVTRAHARLIREHGSDNVLSLPFQGASSALRGAFTFERAGTRPFGAREVELCQAVVALCSRILEEKRLNARSLPARLSDEMRAQFERVVGPRHFGRKLALLVLVLAVGFFSVARGNYRVGGHASLEGSVRRVLVAPFDGYVETAAHRAGDVVASGVVLATLDPRDLQLEYLRWASQSEQYVKQYQESVAKSDRVQINVTLAQLQQAKAQMDLLGEQLARSRIAAPFAGVVVSGDLSQSLGGVVKRGQTLFEIAPLKGYRVIIEVDESDIHGFRTGLTGHLMLSALPGETFPVTITQVTPVTSSREGRSYFRVEASVDVASDRLRPGMEGVARISMGERHYFWQWTHRLFDWVRLSVWSWI